MSRVSCVGHATDEEARTGVTALLCDAGWAAGSRRAGRRSRRARKRSAGTGESRRPRSRSRTGRRLGVRARGSRRGGRGLIGPRRRAAACGQARRAIPIVPCAVLHDLGNGGNKAWGLTPPYRALGIRALHTAGTEFALGSVGAGRGAMAGLVKGGIGSASLNLGEGLVIGALVALNSVGSALMPDGRTYWAWAFELDDELGGAEPPSVRMDLSDPAPDASRLASLGRLQTAANTTLAVVACTSDLSTAECKRMAIMAHDGIARAVRPAHTPFDGDTVFALASGRGARSRRIARRPCRAHRFGGRRLREPRHCARRASRPRRRRVTRYLSSSPIRGVAAISAFVYSRCGVPNTLAVGPSSTIRPCCVTYTRSAIERLMRSYAGATTRPAPSPSRRRPCRRSTHIRPAGGRGPEGRVHKRCSPAICRPDRCASDRKCPANKRTPHRGRGPGESRRRCCRATGPPRSVIVGLTSKISRML